MKPTREFQLYTSYKTQMSKSSVSLSAITFSTGCVYCSICFDEAVKKIVPGRRISFM